MRLVDLDQITDERGTLTVIQHRLRLQRAFVVTGVDPDVTRGHHAHRKCAQLLTCLAGECYVWAEDHERQQIFSLNQPSVALYLPPMTWAFQFGFSADAALLVLASRPYDKNDYITDYEEFNNENIRLYPDASPRAIDRRLGIA